jgi:hypothetical protein
LSLELGNNISACVNNNPIQLNANVVGGTKPYQYFWTPTAGLSSISIPNPIVDNTQLRNIQYKLSVADASGCEVKDSISVQISPRPTLTLGNDTILCKGNSLLLTTQINAVAPISGTRWFNSINNTQNNTSNITVRPLENITYYAQATDVNGCETNIDSVKINLSSIGLEIVSDKLKVCQNDSINLSANVIGENSPWKYLWSPSNLFSNPSLSTNRIALKTASQIRLDIENAVGCVASDTITLNVSDLSTNAGADKAVCLGQSIQLGASIIGGQENYLINWSPASNLNLNNVLNPTIQSSAIGSFEYVLAITDGAGCKSLDTISLRVSDLPVANAGNDTTKLCEGFSTNIGGVPSASGGAGAPFTYAWNTNQSSFTFSNSNISNPLITVSSMSGKVFLTITDQAGCSNSDTAYVQVNLSPQTTVLASDEKACLPNLINYSIQNIDNNVDYTWIDNASGTILSNQTNLQIPRSGFYTLLSVNKLSACKDSLLIDVQYSEKPKNLNILSSADKCINAPVVLTGSANGVDISYLWSTTNGFGIFTSLNTVNTNYLPNERLDPILPNQLTVKLIAQNECGKDSITTALELKPSVLPSFKTDFKDILPGTPVNFLNTTDTLNKGLVNFAWSFGDGARSNTFNTAHIYGDAGIFNVLLISKNSFNCSDTASLAINVIGSQIFYIPNVIAPMAKNSENSRAKIYGAALLPEGFEWNIYNRWGESIYSTQNAEEAKNIGWNGKYANTGEELPLGVYTYTLKAKLSDGKEIEKTGTITLVR